MRTAACAIIVFVSIGAVAVAVRAQHERAGVPLLRRRDSPERARDGA